MSAVYVSRVCANPTDPGTYRTIPMERFPNADAARAFLLARGFEIDPAWMLYRKEHTGFFTITEAAE